MEMSVDIRKSCSNSAEMLCGSNRICGTISSKWTSNLNSDTKNLAIECANHLYFGHWELFRSLALTLISEDREPYDKKYVLQLLKSLFYHPHVYCKGSTSIDTPQQLYWLCSQFFKELCGDKDEAEALMAEAGFRLLLFDLHDPEVEDVLAELYSLFQDYSSGVWHPESVLSMKCQYFLTDLLSNNTGIGCAILESLFHLEHLKFDHGCHRLELLTCLHESLEQCLTKLDLDGGSTFHSEKEPSTTRSSVYRLLLLCEVLMYPNLPPVVLKSDLHDSSSEDLYPSQSMHEERSQKLIGRLLQFCEREILDRNIVFSICLSHGGDLWLVRALCRLEDQTRHRLEVKDAAVSAANFQHLVRDRNGRLNAREMFLHSVINGTHFLETIVTSCTELISSGDSLLAYCMLEDEVLCRLKPLVLLCTWTQIKSIAGIARFLESYKLLFSNDNVKELHRNSFDPVLVAACDGLASKARLMLWALNNNWSNQPKKSQVQHQNLLDMLPKLSSMSALYILNQCSLISCIPRNKAFEALGACNAACRRLKQVPDEMVLRSYYVMCDFSRVVEDGIKVQHMIEECRRLRRQKWRGDGNQGPDANGEDAAFIELKVTDAKRFYGEIVKRLDRIRTDVAGIFPLEYRVEILENAFSLLFAMHHHVKEGSADRETSPESSDEGNEGPDDGLEYPISNREAVGSMDAVSVSVTEDEAQTTAKTGTGSSSDSMDRRRRAIFAKEEKSTKGVRSTKYVKSPKLTMGRKETGGNSVRKKSNSPKHKFAAAAPMDAAFQRQSTHSSECNGSARNSSTRSTSSSVHNLPSLGFIVNALVARDLLECVQRCASDILIDGSEVGSGADVSQNTLKCKVSRLEKYVSEAQWRLQLVVDDGIPMTYGEFPRLPLRQLGADSWARNFYVDYSDSDEDGMEQGRQSEEADDPKPVRKVSHATQQSAIGKFPSFEKQGIISKMLAPHESLLNMCLQQNEFVKSKQVIKVFGMENTSKAAEVDFAIAYEKTIRHMLKPGVTSPGTRLVRSPSLPTGPTVILNRSTWESIFDAAQAGAESATAAEVIAIDELLAAHQVPEVCEWEAAMARIKSMGQTSWLSSWMPERVDWRALVKADLAVLGCSRVDVALNVLESCRRALRCDPTESPNPSAQGVSHLPARSSRQKPIVGLSMLKYLENIMLLTLLLTGAKPVGWEGPRPKRPSCVRSLLVQSGWPLLARRFERAMDTWGRLEGALVEFNSLLQKEEVTLGTPPSRGSASSSLSSSPVSATFAGSPSERFHNVTPETMAGHALHVLYQKLMRLATIARLMLTEDEQDYYSTATQKRHSDPASAAERIPAYMLTLQEYAKNIHSFLPRLQSQHYLASGSYFSIFRHSPSAILKQLLYNTSITPLELEEFAKQLNLNLLHVVVQHSCPYIPAIGAKVKSKVVESSEQTEISNSSGVAKQLEGKKISSDSPGNLELMAPSPLLMDYVRSRCWLAALVMRELGCTSRTTDRSPDKISSKSSDKMSSKSSAKLLADRLSDKSSNKSSNKMCSTVDSDDARVDQHSLIFHPILHRFLQDRTGGAHHQSVKHSSTFPFLPSVSEAHVAATLKEYEENKDWLGLLQYTDGWECQGAGVANLVAKGRDDALVCLFKIATSEEQVGMAAAEHRLPAWMYALQVRESLRRFEIVCDNYRQWQINAVVILLSSCASDVRLEEVYQKRAKVLLLKIKMYHEVTGAIVAGDLQLENIHINPAIFTWQDALKLFETSPAEMLNCLMASRKYDLIVRWSKVHLVTEDVRQICSESAVLVLLDAPNVDPSTLQKALEEIINVRNRFSIYLKILDYMCEKPNCAALLLFVVDSSDFEGVDAAEVKLFMRKKIGIKVLLCLQDEEKGTYLHLVTQPHLMIEQLLMNYKIETIQRVNHSVRDDIRMLGEDDVLSYDSLDRLLEVYASKAIDFRIGQTSSEQNASMQATTESPEGTEKAFKKFVVPAQVPTKSQWIPDSAASRCAVCEVEQFSMFNRRHHCRRCGRVICATCSQHKSIVAGYDDIPVRICDDCYAVDDPLRQSIDSGDSQELPPETVDQRLKAHFSRTNDDVSRAKTSHVKTRHESTGHLTCRLTLDGVHNKTAREEFSYEQAPNIALCLSIIDLRWDQRKAADYLIHVAETLFAYLQPLRPGVSNPEVDHHLIISLLRTIFLSARVKFSKLPDNDRDAAILYCDVCLSLTDFLQLLVNANCKHLIPVGDYTNTKAVSQSLVILQDRLIREERWDLALEVSTKGGLNVSVVWTVWGMTCLKFGSYAAARQKFSHCLQRTPDKNKPAHANALLGQILQRLEKQSSVEVVTPDNIKSFRQRLEAIKNGNMQAVEQHGTPPNTLAIREECLYYIKTYGNHETTLAFYMRHNEYHVALQYIHDEKCLPSAFVAQVAIPSLRKGCWHKIQEAAQQIDRTLENFAPHFGALCRYLECHKLLYTLYGMQRFLKDHIRAAVTCLQFYQQDALDYSDLYDRLPHLVNARHHLQTYRQHFGSQHEASKKLVMHLPLTEVDRYLRSVAFQDEVTKFLHGRSSFWQEGTSANQSDTSSVSSSSMSLGPASEKEVGAVATVFYDPTSRACVVAMVILAGKGVSEGFDLGMRILREYRLRAPNVFSLVARQMLLQRRTSELPALISCMKEMGKQTDETCDKVLLKAITLAVSLGSDAKNTDILTNLLVNEDNMIEAQIQCGKLKSAYLLAVRKENVPLVQRIVAEAIRTRQATVKTICEKWLNGRQTN